MSALKSDPLMGAARALGRQLAAHRRAAHPAITQHRLADSMPGFSRSMIAKAETGRQIPGREFWVLADAVLYTNGALVDSYDRLQAMRRAQASQEASDHRRGIGDFVGPAHSRRSLEPAQDWTVFEAPQWGTTGVLLGHEVSMATDFTGTLAAASAAASDLDLLDEDIRRLAVNFTTMAPHVLARDLAALRRKTFVLIEHNRNPGQLRILQVQAARIAGLFAHLLLDGGDYARAVAMTKAAWICADTAGDPDTLSWIRSVQSLIAYWSGDCRQAAALAADGASRLAGGTLAVRLSGLAARARGQLGDARGVLTAIRSADRTRDQLTSARHTSDLPGLFDFPESKEASYAATALLSLGRTDQTSLAVARSIRAIELQRSASPHQGPDLLAAYLDLGTARVLEGSLDGALEAVEYVAAAPATSRSASIRQRARRFNALLGTQPVGTGGTPARLREILESLAWQPATQKPSGRPTT